MTEIEEIYHSLYYGASKFLDQLGIRKMTIGLSGGIDSAVTAAFYVHILARKMCFSSTCHHALIRASPRALPKRWQKPGTHYAVIPIEESVSLTEKQLQSATIHDYGTGKDETLSVSSFALENIQARDRGARVIAGMASLWGGGFSCNSNKSEMTVGYATFYGDIAGVMALIGDLWKHQVYALGRYLNEQVYHKDVIPDEVFTIKPSAELSQKQTVGTGGDPLHYPYHDYLFRAFVESWGKQAPEEFLAWYLDSTLDARIGCEEGYPISSSRCGLLYQRSRTVVEPFCGLSVAKRIQLRPSFHFKAGLWL